MASHEHHNKQGLLSSAPPSPPSARRRNRKRHDSFEKLAGISLPSPPGTPTQQPVAEEDQDSLLSKIILTPVLFVSFILSLTIVNFADRAHRARAHSNNSLFTYLYPSSWLDPEPYQDPDKSTWDRRGTSTHVEPHDAIGPKQGGQPEKKRMRPWHLHRKIRKVAKLEISDAFDMRGKVMVGMCATMVVGSMMAWMGLKWAFASVAGFLS
ncbi:hypothetical protein ACEQ8H_000164 [Pleosporales sp. CAS-2024a]